MRERKIGQGPEHCVYVDRDAPVPEMRFPPVFNAAAAFIDRHVEDGNADKPALRTDTADISYGQLAENVSRCGNALLDLGLAAGDTLIMAVLDSPMFFYLFWGAVKAGIVPVPVSTFLDADGYAFLIRDSGCRAYVYSPQLKGAAAAGGDAAGALLFAMPAAGAGSLESRLPKAAPKLEAARTNEDTECFWLYSSGSTGNPKGVVHVHRDMAVTSEFFGQGIAGIRANDTVYCAGKLFFSFGFGGGMTFPLWAGAATVVREETTTAELTFDVIERHRPDVFFGVPTLYAQQLHLAETRPVDMSSIRTAISAGEALPAQVFHQARERLGITILDGIGSTEMLHIFVSNRASDIKPGSSGRPVPGYEVRIVDEDGAPVPDGEFGTLHVKGGSAARCYWNNPEKTAATMLGDWLNTGDVYMVDDEGYYVNAGRGDDMLKVGGMWCSPLEIEAHLLQHPGVREVAVVGRTDEDALTKPAAYVVAADPAAPQDDLTEELRLYCKSGLAGYKYPHWIYFIDALPKTPTGKIQRFRLRDLQT